MTIIEAVLLSVVAVLAAWSGFAAAKWGTESSLDLAKASAARTEANRAAYRAADLKNFDALTFNAWFTAYVAGNKNAMQVAEGYWPGPRPGPCPGRGRRPRPGAAGAADRGGDPAAAAQWPAGK